MSEDWNVGDKLYYPTYKHEGELHVTEVNLEILRQKLIEELCPELLKDGEPYPGHDHIPQDKIYKTINKLFGVKK